ncbi:c-type cytochrome [Sphingobium yanoikuyae]|uniref:c-type cytochrome n=1 Tax=Sphingobium yanoikuyae TaxID=13690 RepID=UPI0035B40396
MGFGLVALATGAVMIPAISSQAQTAPAASPAFNACRACHSVQPGGKSGLGPNLVGVVGRTAGTLAGFNYSPALKASKLKWDEKALDEYLAAPTKKVPGSRMPISTPDPAKRAAIITYLKSVK